MADKLTPQKVLDVQAERKPSEWPTVPIKVGRTAREYLKTLPIFEALGNPLSEFLPEANPGQRFIALAGGKLYYVNTEGYRYCRYAALIGDVLGSGIDLPTTMQPITYQEAEEILKPAQVEVESNFEPSKLLGKKINKVMEAAHIMVLYLEHKGYPGDTKPLVKLLKESLDEFKS